MYNSKTIIAPKRSFAEIIVFFVEKNKICVIVLLYCFIATLFYCQIQLSTKQFSHKTI